VTNQPVIILVRPQLGENIGKSARAMLNFGLTEIRLVAPRDGWPNPDAGPSAAGADQLLDDAQVFNTVDEAVNDLSIVYAATVRPRDMVKSVEVPEGAIKDLKKGVASGKKVGIMFGPERSGLSNDDITSADKIVTVPVNPEFCSLNLAQAIILMAYEWHKAGGINIPSEIGQINEPATKQELQSLISHVEDELQFRDYFRPKAREPKMRQTLRNLWQSAGFDSQQIRTLRGVFRQITRPKSDD